MKEKIKFKKVYLWAFLISISIIVITICSKCSFLYVFNDWVDANCFLTTGRAMFNGKVLYRDIYEQKGPLLYFIYGFSSMIFGSNFFGIYILEIICTTVFLYFSYKVCYMFLGKKGIILIPILAMMIYTSVSFGPGGSVEEICLPLFMFSFYKVLKYINDNPKEITKTDIKILVLQGFLAGCVFYIKFTLDGFYIGVILFYVLYWIRRGKIKEAIKCIEYFIIGCIISSIPWIIYFVWNNSVFDFYKSYIYNNMFLYSENKEIGVVNKLYNSIKLTLYSLKINKVYFIPIIVGNILFVFSRNNKVLKAQKIVLIILGILTSVGIFYGGRGYVYYGLPLTIFLVTALVGIMDLLSIVIKVKNLNNNRYIGYIITIFISILCIIGCYMNSHNVGYIKYTKNDYPQYKFANIISKKPNSTLLNYGALDIGVYTASEKLPINKFFCRLNIDLEEMTEDQLNILKNKEVDYVVTVSKIYDAQILKNYNLISNESMICLPNYSDDKYTRKEFYLYEAKK